MKKFILLLALIFCANSVLAEDVPNMPAYSAIQKLKVGNERFVQMQMKHPNLTKERREMLAKSQYPFVAILSCSDSRVPTELIFDQGLGDIFVIRNAGNVMDEHVMGSIEYAVEHLGVNLVVVLGHESCGAVGAAMKEEKASAGIESLKKAIAPAVAKTKKENNYTYENVIKTHTQMDVDEIVKNPEIMAAMKKRGVKIVPAYYNLKTGVVDFCVK